MGRAIVGFGAGGLLLLLLVMLLPILNETFPSETMGLLTIVTSLRGNKDNEKDTGEGR